MCKSFKPPLYASLQESDCFVKWGKSSQSPKKRHWAALYTFVAEHRINDTSSHQRTDLSPLLCGMFSVQVTKAPLTKSFSLWVVMAQRRGGQQTGRDWCASAAGDGARALTQTKPTLSGWFPHSHSLSLALKTAHQSNCYTPSWHSLHNTSQGHNTENNALPIN